MIDKLNKVHFPNLDGLRFIGSLTILLLHVEGVKKRFGVEPIRWITYFDSMGGHAVSLFFVLSGFLITYLLLRERENTSTINLKNFYIKRILKIWPLYYLIGLIGFFLLPCLNFEIGKIGPHPLPQFVLYCLFLPVPRLLYTYATWSVRVEEVFYLIWPLLLRRCKNYMKVFIYTIICIVVIRNGMGYLMKYANFHVFDIHLIYNYRVSCMAIGGIAAYIFIKDKREVLLIIYRKDVQWAIYCITAILLILRVRIPFINFEFYSMLFAGIIINLGTNPNSILKLDYKWTNYLGKISYGLYLYNPITVNLCLDMLEHLFGQSISGGQMNLLLYSTTIISTILISVLSFELFEKYFLKQKIKFTAIKT
jgi:peptidoglycan/LPS O-acetylase OafA/YrhL